MRWWRDDYDNNDGGGDNFDNDDDGKTWPENKQHVRTCVHV